MNNPKHPIQPLVTDDYGVVRFKQNTIVLWLVDQVPECLNTITSMDFSQEDHEQLAQLIGYSHSGAGDLSYMSSEVLSVAEHRKDNPEVDELTARNQYFRDRLQEIKDKMRDAVSDLYEISEDDLA